MRIGSSIGSLLAQYLEWKAIEAVPAPCPAGSIVIHNGMIGHAAGPNMTPHPRHAMTSVYFPDGETYNGQSDTLPAAYVETLKEGDSLTDDRYLPLVF